jgi:hypothetical protein
MVSFCAMTLLQSQVLTFIFVDLGLAAATNEVEMRNKENQRELAEAECQLELDKPENKLPKAGEAPTGPQGTRPKPKKMVHWKEDIEEHDDGKDSSYIYEEPVDVLTVSANDASGHGDENIRKTKICE